LLNQQNWTLPAAPKRTSLPDAMFSSADAMSLKDFSYNVAGPEFQRLHDLYSSPGAQEAGYMPSGQPAGAPTVKMEGGQAVPLTWDAYQALSDDQKAAVDFNSLLVTAREADLSDKTPLEGLEEIEYDKAVTEMFGEAGGSAVQAPAVVSLLRKVNFSAVGQDLDEFLSLERAVDASELKDFKISNADVKAMESFQLNEATPAGRVERNKALGQARTPENIQAVESAVIEQSRTMIETAMQDANNAIWSFQQLAGGAPGSPDQVPLGYGQPGARANLEDANMDSWLQKAYEHLSTPGNDGMKTLESDMQLYEFTPEDRQIFHEYIDRRTSMEAQYGTSGNSMLKPEDIRALAGLGK
jgi:hypothetical protein